MIQEAPTQEANGNGNGQKPAPDLLPLLKQLVAVIRQMEVPAKPSLSADEWEDQQVSKLVNNPLLQASDYRCALCGRDLLDSTDAMMTWTRDHLVAHKVSRGRRDNLVAACYTCNQLKNGSVVVSLEQARVLVRERRESRERVWRRVRQIVRGE